VCGGEKERAKCKGAGGQRAGFFVQVGLCTNQPEGLR